MVNVRLEDVTKSYEDTVAVKNLNHEIRDKDLAVLVGPSGCGKSTTLRMIAGLETPTSGEIYIDDKVVNDLSPTERDVAMVFQELALYPHMTAYDNMAFGLRNLDYSDDEIEEKIEGAVEYLGIEELMDRKPSRMSGGQRQRVALGRALVRDPDVYLWDEPLSSLDAKQRRKMRAELQEIHKEIGATTILVTHDQTEAFTMGDRIAVMNDGEILQSGEPRDIYKDPNSEFVGGFMGSPPMNFFDCSIVENNGDLFLDGGEFSFPIPFDIEDDLKEGISKTEVRLGVRPEHINIVKSKSSETISAEIRVIEKMDTYQLVHLTIGGMDSVMKADPDLGVEVDTQVEVKFEPEEICIFEKASGKSLL